MVDGRSCHSSLVSLGKDTSSLNSASCAAAAEEVFLEGCKRSCGSVGLISHSRRLVANGDYGDGAATLPDMMLLVVVMVGGERVVPPFNSSRSVSVRYFCFVLRQLSGCDDRPTDSEDRLDLPLTAGIKSVPSLVCSSALSEGRYQFNLV